MASPVLAHVARRNAARGPASCLRSFRGSLRGISSSSAKSAFSPVPVKPRLSFIPASPAGGPVGVPPPLTDSSPAWSANPITVPPRKRTTFNTFVQFNRGDALASTHDGRRLVWGGEKSKPHGMQTAFSVYALRASCPCPSCLDPQTGTRLEPLLDRMPPKLRFSDVVRIEDDGLKIRWEGDTPEHMTDRFITYTGQYLRKMSIGSQLPITDWGGNRAPAIMNWKGSRIASMLSRIRVDYRDWVTGDLAVLQYGLRILKMLGILFLSNIPDDADSISRIAQQIGPQMETIYGTTWESTPKRVATNISETHREMLLHQDLVYMPEPPRFKVLHCVRNSCFGGESLFSDTLGQAVKTSLALGAEQLATLATYPAVYEHVHQGKLYRQARPILSLCPDTIRLNQTWWSPQFRATPGSWQSWEPETVEKWYVAQNAYNKLINGPRYRIDYRFGEGEGIIVDNRRILSGRKAFDPFTGERLFRGTYIADAAVEKAYELLPDETTDERIGTILTGPYRGQHPPPRSESEPEPATLGPGREGYTKEFQSVDLPDPQLPKPPESEPGSIWRKFFQR